MILQSEEIDFVIQKDPRTIISTNDMKLAESFHFAVLPNDDKYFHKIISDDLKFLIRIELEFFHTIADTLAIAASEFKKNKDLLVIFDISKKDNMIRLGLEKDFNDVIEILEKSNINYMLHDFSKKTLINNFYFVRKTQEYPRMQSYIAFKELISTHFSDLLSKPNDKIYVSRVGYYGRTRAHHMIQESDSRDPFENDVRMFDEEKLEKYFQGIGFKIIRSEDLNGIIEKIAIFSSAKILVGVTGAALANSIFMAPGSTLFEISVPMFTTRGNKIFSNLHELYKDIANVLDYTYITIFSPKDPDIVINKINSNRGLKNILVA